MAAFTLDTSGVVDRVRCAKHEPVNPRPGDLTTIMRGEVRCSRCGARGSYSNGRPSHGRPRKIVWLRWRWPDLDPFTQGTLAAASEEADRQLGETFERRHGSGEVIGFKDWSPEALALILRDCAALMTSGPYGSYTLGHGAVRGGEFWRYRQEGKHPDRWPPLTVSLSDEGKVVLS